MDLKEAQLADLSNGLEVERTLEVTHGEKQRRVMPIRNSRGDDGGLIGLRHSPPRVLARGVVDGEQELNGVDGLRHAIGSIRLCEPTEDRNIATIES
jgi:hypothetical protein